MAQSRPLLLLFLAVLLSACSNPEHALWYEMHERRMECERVTALVHAEQADQLLISDSILSVADTVIAFVDEVERRLLEYGGVLESYTEQASDVDEPAYYDHDTPTALLIGPEPTMAKHGPFTALELNRLLEEFKRDMARVGGLTRAQMDAHLFNGADYKAPGGLLVSWEAGQFYHMPMATVIGRLEAIKTGVRRIQHEGLVKRRWVLGGDSTNVETGHRP